MNPGADGKGALKDVVRGHLDKAASALFINKSLAIIDESADNKESFMDAAVRISKRIALFIDKDLAQTVYDSLMTAIEKVTSPQGTRRRYKRVSFYKKVGIQYDGRQYELDCTNLSEGGIFTKTDDPLPDGTELEITLPLEFGSRIHSAGVVIYRRVISGETSRLPSGMGIKFVGIRDEDAEMLRDYIRKVPVDSIFVSKQ